MKPSETYTIQDFITAGASVEITYAKTSILEKVGTIEYPVHNIIYDYMEELLAVSVLVTLTDKEYQKYLYSPKILAYDLYGYTDFYFIIMALNNICNVKDFNFRKVRVLRPSDLSIVNRIMVAEKKYIQDNRERINAI